MSNFLLRRTLVTMMAFFAPILANAQAGAAACKPGEYHLIVSIGNLSGCVTLAKYLDGIIMTLIGIAGILAVVMLVICGVRIIGTASASGKSAAKECIWNAVFGVLLALGSWTILNTINSSLLFNAANLPDVALLPPASSPPPGTPGGPAKTVAPMPTNPGFYFRYIDPNGNTQNSARFDLVDGCLTAERETKKAPGVTIANGPNGTPGCFEVVRTPTPAGELATRVAICGNDSCFSSSATKVFINHAACTGGRTKGCTNVNGLPGGAISAIQALPAACGCNITITGGTEDGHASHGPNIPVFDLGVPTKLNQIITNSGPPNVSFCDISSVKQTGNCYKKWLYNGFWYTNEGDHWHVCQDGTPAPAGKSPTLFKYACTKI